jgi:hypothetical protein
MYPVAVLYRQTDRQTDLPQWLHGVTACLTHKVQSTFLSPIVTCAASHLFLAHNDAVAP